MGSLSGVLGASWLPSPGLQDPELPSVLGGHSGPQPICTESCGSRCVQGGSMTGKVLVLSAEVLLGGMAEELGAAGGAGAHGWWSRGRRGM